MVVNGHPGTLLSGRDRHVAAAARPVVGRIHGLDLVPVGDCHPVEWLSGTCPVTVTVDVADIAAIVEVFQADAAVTIEVVS